MSKRSLYPAPFVVLCALALSPPPLDFNHDLPDGATDDAAPIPSSP